MKIHHSIQTRLTITMIALTAGMIVLCVLINNTLLAGYYRTSKEKALENAYYQICTAMEGTESSENIEIQLEKMGAKSNITYIVEDASSGILTPIYYNVNGSVSDVMRQYSLLPYILGLDNSSTLIQEHEHYNMYAIKDHRYNASYIELYGRTEDGKIYMLLRTPVESIHESVEISNRFLIYVGIFVCIVAGVIMFFVTKKITKPILRLAEISKQMSDMNFNIRYEGHDRDEIGILGHSVNQLSEKLEKTISELKSVNNELQKDIEQKTQIDEMRKEFLSNVSHELKTPIALIQGYAEGLKDCVNEDEENREFYCDVIMDEADKMNQMVKKLLTLNQIESGQEQTNFEQFDLTAVIRGVIQSVDILCRQSEVTIEFTEKESIYVWGDEYQIEEVVTNYISNAIHYALGEKKIQVNMKRLEKTVRVSVFNTGNPIPESDLKKIWGKFYKVDKARTREYGGNGIGLSIVKAIMDAHHQAYGVANWANGVEFWFEVDGQNSIE